MRGVYYNEIDAFAAQWLRKLMAAKLIPEGDVDERSICDVQPEDLRGYRQCHFFAGIAGWSRALYLAQWPEDREVWSGSCPCQPISCAGNKHGHADERHLWPAFFNLISECRPSVVFGEQVSGSLGVEWFAGVRADLENAGYACGGGDLCAASVQAPHVRQRIFWCALADSECRRQSGSRKLGESCRSEANSNWEANQSLDAGEGFWANAEWRQCADGKQRRVKPGLHLLADGIPSRMGRLRGFGNAIVPPLAAEFIKAVMEVAP